jgi:hypothetical protein
MKKLFFNIIVLLLVLCSTAQDRTRWFEFYLPWNDSSKTVTDMSAYLDAPAGKHGFLQVTPDGHFKFENKPGNERFVGVVNVAVANFPTKEQAKIIAARMAKFGINLVRIHLMDVEGVYGLFQNSSQNTLQISADRLDKMDYFIKCMKDKGIYFNFCIHAGRVYKTGDGIDSPVKNDQSKYITLFNQKLIDLQKDFAQKIIGHVNPYTKLTYANDPAMATVELTNENSLFNGWLGWQGDFIFGETTGGIGPFYSNELDVKFNNWLAGKYENDSLLAAAWKGEGSTAVTELVKNGSFEQNLTNWASWINSPTVQGTFTADNTVAKDGTKSLKANVTKTGEYGWYFQIKTNNFSVKKNASYKLSFYARAYVEKELYMDIMENETWKYIAGPAFTTSKDWKRYEVFFTSSFQSNKVIVQFNFGKQTGTFWLDSVSITESFGTGLETGETLAEKNVKRVKNSEIGKYSKQRVGDNAEFYFDIEKKYTDELSAYLKNNLDVQCPITFTNNYFGLADMYAQSQADYIDFHMYWDHPNFPNGWSNIDFSLNNKSILLNPEGSTINKMPLTKVKNMPHVLSEYNHAYPYIFQTEAPSLLFAYGSFFDLDGIMWHAYYDYMNNFSQRYQDMFFDIAMHPVMMTQMLLALPYRMGYIQKAKTFAEGNYRTRDIFDNTKTYQDNEIINIENAEYGTSFLQHGFRHGNFEADSTYLTGKLANPGKVITTETNELKWDGNLGVFTVNNPYWQGATGYLGGKNIELENITISNVTTTDNLNFASIQLISLDSLPISKSKRMMFLSSARLENQGLKWNETKTSLLSAGGTKALCEPVEAVVTFKSSKADSLSVYVLTPTGNRSDSLLVNQSAESVKFSINKNTLWYEISNHTKKVITQGTRIGKRSGESSIKASPNPGKNYTTIEFSFPENTEADFIIYNSFGQLVMTEQVLLAGNQLQQKRIDVSQFGDGIYFYGFQFKNGKRIIDKLVVSK